MVLFSVGRSYFRTYKIMAAPEQLRLLTLYPSRTLYKSRN